jgi:cytochrome c556
MVLLALVGTAWASDPAPAPAASPADKAYSYRHEVFESLGAHMKALSMHVKGEVDRPADREAHAKAILEMSKIVPGLFPAGTGPDVVKSTEAKAEIWTDAAGFQAAAQAFRAEAEKLVAVANTTNKDEFKGQLGKVGQSCGGCHDKYRVKDD